MNLREEVERRLPNWRTWYPSLFDAAVDLGLLRARPCDPASLLLTNRHAGIRHQAEQAHREKWGGAEDPEDDQLLGVRRQLRAARRGAPGRGRR